METDKALIGGIIFIVLVLGANFIMYAVVRGETRPGGGKSFLETFTRSLNTSSKKKDDSMEELHRKIEELNQGKKDETGDSE
jgi:hypothetical protein